MTDLKSVFKEKIMKYLFIAFFSLISFLGIAQEGDDNHKIELNGFVRNYMGVLTESPSDFSILQNTVNLEIKQQNDKIGFYANPYLYHYANKIPGEHKACNVLCALVFLHSIISLFCSHVLWYGHHCPTPIPIPLHSD